MSLQTSRPTVAIPAESIELPHREKRVGLTPMGVRELCTVGARVFVEHDAGRYAGYTDEEYTAAGATIVYHHEEVFQRGDIIVKIARPQPDEYALLRENQVLLAFFHLAVAPPELVRVLIERRITAIGYEIIQSNHGELPILKPMSQITGAMAPQIAGHLLEAGRHEGRGILLPGLPGIPPSEVVIIGAGNLGTTAARMFTRLGTSVYATDTNLGKLEALHQSTRGRVVTLKSTRANLEKLCRFADVLILAVLEPGLRAPVLITENMVESMKPGAVILDFAINQGGAAATSRPTTGYDDTYRTHDVVHFCMPNVPALVPRTASYALTNAILEDLLRLIQHPIQSVLAHFPHLRRGVYTHRGFWTCASFSFPDTPSMSIEQLLEENTGGRP